MPQFDILAPTHSPHVGHRTMRTADRRWAPMFFGRCSCGWEGPSRIKRSAAVEDNFAHIRASDDSA